MNRIGEILRERGINELAPNGETLAEIGITLHTWNKFVANKKDPSFSQIPIMAKFLNVEIEELFPKENIKGNIKVRHGLIHQ